MEHESIRIGNQAVRELADPAVFVGLAGGQKVVSAVELDLDAARRFAALRVENMSRKRGGHRQRHSIPPAWTSLVVQEAARLEGMLVGDLVLVGTGERAVVNDLLAADVEAVRAVGRGQHQRCDDIVRSAELQPRDRPDGYVSAFPGLERADVVATEHRRSAAGAGDEEGLLRLEE